MLKCVVFKDFNGYIKLILTIKNVEYNATSPNKVSVSLKRKWNKIKYLLIIFIRIRVELGVWLLIITSKK